MKTPTKYLKKQGRREPQRLLVVLLLVTLVLAASMSNQAYAFTPPKIEKELLPNDILKSLHEVQVLIVDKKSDMTKIWELRSEPEVANLVILDLSRSLLTAGHIGTVKHWARAGNGILLASSEKHKDLVDSFGIKTAGGKKGVALSVGQHPLLTDVNKLFFKGKIGYKSGYDQPLFSIDKTPCGVVKKIGNGFVVSLPTFEANYDAQRFWVNLKEYAAGYMVPGSAATGGVTVKTYPKVDTILLNNGNVYTGKVLNEAFTVQTWYGDLTIESEKIAEIILDGKIAQLFLGNRDRFSGTLQETIDFKLLSGEKISLKLSEIKKILFRRERLGG